MKAIRTLLPFEYGTYRCHLLRLSAGDRRLRFGGPIDDDGIVRFVEYLKLRETRLLAMHDPELRLIAAAHIAVGPGGAAEVAFSIDHDVRGRGLGRALLARAILWARNRGIRSLHVHFLAENAAMRALARGTGMTIETRGGECDAELALPPPTPISLWQEAAGETTGLMIFALHVAQHSAPRVATPLAA